MAVNVSAKVAIEKLSRYDLLTWVNNLLKSDVYKIEELCTGAAYCHLMDILFPDSINIKKVKNPTNLEREYIHNFKLLQAAFAKKSVNKDVPINKLIKGRMQDNLEFLQWFKRFFDANCTSADGSEARLGAPIFFRRVIPPPARPPPKPVKPESSQKTPVKGIKSKVPSSATRRPVEEKPPAEGATTYRRPPGTPVGRPGVSQSKAEIPATSDGQNKSKIPRTATRKPGEGKDQTGPTPKLPAGTPIGKADASKSTPAKASEVPPTNDGPGKKSRIPRRATRKPIEEKDQKAEGDSTYRRPAGTPAGKPDVSKPNPETPPTNVGRNKSKIPRTATRKPISGKEQTEVGPKPPAGTPIGKQDQSKTKSEKAGEVPPTNDRSKETPTATRKPVEEKDQAGGDTQESSVDRQLIMERDFYFSKLRDIEIFCHYSEEEEQNPKIQHILALMYETDEGFGPPKASKDEEEINVEEHKN